MTEYKKGRTATPSSSLASSSKFRSLRVLRELRLTISLCRGGVGVLVRAKLALSEAVVAMQLTVRAEDPQVAEIMTTAVA